MQDRGPEFVAFGVQVQSVGAVDLGAGLSGGAEQFGVGVDVVQGYALFGGSLHIRFDEAIAFDELRFFFPAGDGGVHRDVDDARFRQGGVDFVDEGFVVFQDRFGSLAGVDVVAAGIEDDHFGFVGQDYPRGVAHAVGDLRAAEAAIDHFQFREVFGQGCPEADARTSDEEDRVGRRRSLFVRGFEGDDLGFEGRFPGLLGDRRGLRSGVGLLCGYGSGKAPERGTDQIWDGWHDGRDLLCTVYRNRLDLLRVYGLREVSDRCVFGRGEILGARSIRFGESCETPSLDLRSGGSVA